MTERKELQEIVDQAVHHYMGIMFEEFQHRLDLVIEKVGALEQRVQKVETRMERLEDKVDQLNIFVRATFHNIERLLADHSAEIASLKCRSSCAT